MLLEKQILAGSDSALAPRPAKRARGAAAPLPEGTIAWVEMARYMYGPMQLLMYLISLVYACLTTMPFYGCSACIII